MVKPNECRRPTTVHASDSIRQLRKILWTALWTPLAAQAQGEVSKYLVHWDVSANLYFLLNYWSDFDGNFCQHDQVYRTRNQGHWRHHAAGGCG